MFDVARKRAELIEQLQGALAIANELNDDATGYLIERALDDARARQIKSVLAKPPSDEET
jgi:DNA-binding ferritin-like protein